MSHVRGHVEKMALWIINGETLYRYKIMLVDDNQHVEEKYRFNTMKVEKGSSLNLEEMPTVREPVLIMFSQILLFPPHDRALIDKQDVAPEQHEPLFLKFSSKDILYPDTRILMGWPWIDEFSIRDPH